MSHLEPLKFRTMRREGKNGKAIDIGDVLINYHPSMKGWKSEKFCIYPQSIILQVFRSILSIFIQMGFSVSRVTDKKVQFEY